MESFFVRYRNFLVLLAILLAQIVGLAVQVHRTDSGRNTDARDGTGVRLIRMWAEALVSPPERLIHSSKTGVGGLWGNYIDLRHVREQNQELQKTIDRLRLEQAELIEDAKQGQRLQAMLNFQEKYIYKTVAAQAIGTSGSDQSKVFFIDKGSADGLDRDMAVISADGIVGKVRDVFPHTAQVLAVNDQTSGAGVILETTRIRGILRGNANGQLEMVDILQDQRIKPGEKVLTAGGDMIFPRGLPVGVVEKVVPDPDRDSFIDVMITPAAHLDRLDEVLVITSTLPRLSPQQQQDVATSEAEKGAEAAAIHDQQVKEQQKASAIMAERLPGLMDPNLPPDKQPLLDSSNPDPVTRPAQALRPDRFTPLPKSAGGATDGKPETETGTSDAAKPAVPKAAAPKTTVPKPAAPKPTEPKATAPKATAPNQGDGSPTGRNQ
jgi:rod shape-determining protein MreC